MGEESARVKLVFPVDDFQSQLDYAGERGFLSHVLVEIGGTEFYPICFYSIGELAGELREDPKYPDKFVAETGMIVLPEITMDRMKIAVERLYKNGYFQYMQPLTQEQRLKATTSFKWPP